jgi:aryl-alcohol dehydrogenase-like predicted oxidoreductase
MKTIHIPNLKRDACVLGLGSVGFSTANYAKAAEVANAYVRHAGNFIDTGEVYGGGDCERSLGRWVKERGNRADLIIMDKGCHHPPHPFSPAEIHSSISRCLDKLETDYLDIWAFHRDKADEPVGPLMEALNEEVQRRRIRAFGASNWTASRIAEANQYAEQHGLIGFALASQQVCLATAREPYWAGCLAAAEEEVAYYAKVGLPIAAWSSQGQGFFRDDSGPENTRDADMVRAYHTPENFEKLRRARELAAEKGVGAIQIALAYVLHLAAPIIALVGPQTVAEVESCFAGAEIELTEAEMEWLSLKVGARG